MPLQLKFELALASYKVALGHLRIQFETKLVGKVLGEPHSKIYLIGPNSIQNGRHYQK
jgi:hypothetical protein